ncbi:type IX secretion system membrane protein PorP/SprF [Leptobacterium flavescens]|uniref:Type IX secretion system membrane protein PorP/SprF n=1 Tax=Leptobacterium flavescens TaxID=472055 RepID=A0A6P0URI9_9FLAO|nr:type IX secretion system membrane protein PorP/SprF [Leptobacterium flavescens]NER15547.1 type IX secretion system membrane protein PorP/SprF [Leptobacterium flavescens]
MKIYKSLILGILLIGCSTALQAQQEPVYTLYRYNTGFFNPAALGADDQITFKSNFRSQFVGIDDAPETQSFYLSLPLNEKVGIGLTTIVDNVFIEQATSLFASFSYKLQIGYATDLYFGIQAGGTFVSIDFNRLELPLDPLFSQNANDFNPNLGIGFYLKNEGYFASLSSPRLLRTDRIDDESGIVTTANNELQIHLSGGYHFNLSDEIVFTPSTLVRFSSEETIVDITATFKFLDRFEIGANYRADRAFGGLAYLSIQNWLELGYAYETNTSDINTFEDGTHEIGLTFKF